MIQINNIRKEFGKITALNHVSCECRDGEITGLLGLNGAGKTTLMRIIYGLLQPSAGSVLIDGLDVQQDSRKVRQVLGVLPDDTGLYKRLTASENIRYFGELQGIAPDALQQQMNHLIELLGMQNIANRRAEGFSLGERMKTALARAIVHQPKHILLDEPTNGLDVITTRAVRRLLLSLRDEGRCIVFSSHLMHEVGGLCDRVIIVAGGAIVAQGTISDVIALAGCDNLENAFVTLSEKPVACEAGL